MSEYYDNLGPDEDEEGYVMAEEAEEEWQPGQCDNCSGPPRTDEEKRAALSSAIVPVCACWTGQGASPENCGCGPDPETEEQPTEAGATVPSETQAIERARQVWPEAEGFLRHTRGWTFRVGGGYASVTNGGVVAKEPQGTRFDAVSYMGRRTSPVHLDGPGCTPVRAYVDRPSP